MIVMTSPFNAVSMKLELQLPATRAASDPRNACSHNHPPNTLEPTSQREGHAEVPRHMVKTLDKAEELSLTSNGSSVSPETVNSH